MNTLAPMAMFTFSAMAEGRSIKATRSPPVTDFDMLAMKIPFDKLEPYRFRRGKGCLHCRETGYKGRTGIYEILPMTEKTRRLVAHKSGSDTYGIRLFDPIRGRLGETVLDDPDWDDVDAMPLVPSKEPPARIPTSAISRTSNSTCSTPVTSRSKRTATSWLA